MAEVKISIASINTDLVLPEGEATDAAVGRYAAFDPGATVRAAHRFDVQYCTFDTKDDDKVSVTRSKESLCIERDDFFAEYDFASREGMLYAVDSIYVVDTFLRIFYSLMLPGQNGLLVHASGMIVDARGHLFVGPSGSGKSTAARFSPPGGMLSDELTAVRLRAGVARVYGTPFMGELNTGGHNKSADVAGVYFLDRKLPVDKTRTNAARAVSLMLGSVMNFDTTPKQVSRILETVCSICEKTPCYEFNFDKKGNLLELLNAD